MADQQLATPFASPSSRQPPSEADLGRFHTTSVAMDTPTDMGPGFSWKRPPSQGPTTSPGVTPELPAAKMKPLHSVQDASQIQIPAEDEAVPGPPPSPPAAPPPPPAPSLGVKSSLAPTPASAPASIHASILASAGQAQSSAPPPFAPAAADAAAAAAAAPDVSALAGESRLQTPAQNSAAAEACHASNGMTAAVVDASTAPSSEVARAAALAGPDDDNHDQQKGICYHECILY